MQITKITPQFSTTKITKHKNNNEDQTQTSLAPREKLPMPTAQQLFAMNNPSFCGGYSLNLAETIENLDKLATKYPDIYPKNVREWAGMILEEGNKAKDTLISVHKKLYANVKECFSLEELKTKFPEFKDVKPASEVDAKEGSLLDEILKGQNEIFNNEEDLSLQLIKLYWGEGFSLNDLKAYAGGRDLNGIMNKLNIPKVNRNYGHVLKFSDPEYNERLTKQMTQKRRETMDIKAQQQDGEPVYIKRGPLSPEHRQHISEGLIKYYQENPERIFAMSERQKKFYEDNPEQAQMFRRVMQRAWNIFGAERIKQALSKFLKKERNQNISELTLEEPHKMTKEQSALMKKFWGINEWARKQFSKNVEFSWKKVKEEQNMFYKFDISPERFKQKFYAWCDEQGLDERLTSLDDFKYYPHREELNQLDSRVVSQYTPRFIDSQEGDESAKMANTYQRTLMNFGKELKKLEKDPKVSLDTKNLAFILRQIIRSNLLGEQGGITIARKLGAQEVQEVYTTTLLGLMDHHENRLIKKLNKLLNEAYNDLDRNWKAGNTIYVTPKDFDF